VSFARPRFTDKKIRKYKAQELNIDRVVVPHLEHTGLRHLSQVEVDNTEEFDEVTVLLVTDETTTVSPFTTFGQKTRLQSVHLGYFTFDCNNTKSN